MIGGFFVGTTVSSLQKQADKLLKMKEKFQENKAQAIADRYAAIQQAQQDIEAINKL